MKVLKILIILMAVIVASLKAHGGEDRKNACDVEFAYFFKALSDKREDVDIESLGENFRDGMRISAEEMMLSLSSFDSEGCSGETRKRIQTLFDRAAKLQSGYKKLIELDTEVRNAPPGGLRAAIDEVQKQQDECHDLYEQFLDNKSSMHSYLWSKIDVSDLQ